MSTQQAIDVEATATPQQAVAVREQPGTVGPALAPADIKAPMTAAQAKVDAVAALTMSAYEKAATLNLTKEEAEALRANFPDEAFKPGAAGKEHLIYIEHAFLRERFTEVLGIGQWAIVPRSRWAEPFKTEKGKDGSRIYVEAMLVVRGCFVAEAIGEMEYYPHNASQNYGDAVEGAKTAAFRRCAKEFSVGLQPYKKDWCEGWWARKRAGQRQAPKPLPFPTAEGRAKMIEQLKAGPGGPGRPRVTEFFRTATHGTTTPLLPNEELESLELRWVPVTQRQMKDLAERIFAFDSGEPAAWPYPPNNEAPLARPAKAAKPDKFNPSDDEIERRIEAATAKPTPDSRPALRGKIATVSLKEGKSAKGPWSLWGIKIGDAWANTFSNSIGHMAQSNKGQEVTLFYESGEKGNTALELVLADGTSSNSPEVLDPAESEEDDVQF